MNYTKRQHIIPKFYLNGFAEDSRLQVLDFQTKRSFSNSTKDVSVEKDYYTIKVEGIEPDRFESWLASVESQAAGVFRQILNGKWPLDELDRTKLAHFIVLQQQRGRGTRDFLERVQSEIVGLQTKINGFDKFSEVLDAGIQPHLTEEQKRESFDWITNYKQGDETTIKATSHQHINSINHSISELIPYIVGRPWILIEFTRRALITSDEPLGLTGSTDMEDFGRIGLLHAEALTFPLTRELGLLMNSPRQFIERGRRVEEVREGKFDVRQRGTTSLEQWFNLQTASGATRNVFFHPKDTKFVPHTISSQFPNILG